MRYLLITKDPPDDVTGTGRHSVISLQFHKMYFLIAENDCFKSNAILILPALTL